MTTLAIAGTLFGGGSFVYGIFHGEREEDQLDAIKEQLQELKRNLDGIARSIQSLAAGQERILSAVLYGKDTFRLRFFNDFLANHLNVYDTSEFSVAMSKDWSDNVLSLDDDGAPQVRVVLTVDFGELKTAPTECKEKYFQMKSSASLY